MGQATLPKLFEAFCTTKALAKETGLGLFQRWQMTL